MTTRKIVTHVEIPDQDKFTIKLHPDHKILSTQQIYGYGSPYTFLIEQPDTTDKVSFSFMRVATDTKFDPPKGWTYFGTVLTVVDPDADRPVGVPRHIYGGKAA